MDAPQPRYDVDDNRLLAMRIEQVASAVRDLGEGIKEQLGRLEKKLDQDLERQANQLRDHETRLRDIERSQWRWMGAIAVISAALTFLINWLMRAMT